MSWCVNHWHGATNGRHSLSQPLRAASSLREGAGNGLYHSTGYSLKSGVTGDFHRPYEAQKILGVTIQRAARNSDFFTLHHSSGDTPSDSFADSSLREGAGNGLYHSTGCSLKSGVTGDFHRPYETQNILHSTIQRATRKPEGGGRFSSPLRRLRIFYRSKTSGFHPGTIPGGAGNPRMGTSEKRNQKRRKLYV